MLLAQINTPGDLRAFQREHGLRDDWHEPDEQGVEARVYGAVLGNDHPPGHGLELDEELMPVSEPLEMQVVLIVDGEPKAVVSLATLLSFACGTFDGWLFDDRRSRRSLRGRL